MTISESDIEILYKTFDEKIVLNNMDLSVNIIDDSQILYSGCEKFNLIVSLKK